jgi:hypothetical protein
VMRVGSRGDVRRAALALIMQTIDGVSGLVPFAGGPVALAITAPISVIANQVRPTPPAVSRLHDDPRKRRHRRRRRRRSHAPPCS